ncbi:uncharacterized protein EI90DRAFT_3020898 [Cantharellus anzutake]|uniref:uncharacterized protein n=1 Tax=Cantharellus anzutake TaxID=1750568 RepID=UPI0019061387|nr:uncharacterized protein EI90DRAFT_3020898 [Cantharellus anzutake]KAF8318930.1 hypothetical protein EI90DRAFT_3020898 [Cantharellus anzutake]
MSSYIFYQVYDEQGKLHAPAYGSCDPARYPFVGAFMQKDVGQAPKLCIRCTELFATFDTFAKNLGFSEKDIVNLAENGYGRDPDHPLIFKMLSWDRPARPAGREHIAPEAFRPKNQYLRVCTNGRGCFGLMVSIAEAEKSERWDDMQIHEIAPPSPPEGDQAKAGHGWSKKHFTSAGGFAGGFRDVGYLRHLSGGNDK